MADLAAVEPIDAVGTVGDGEKAAVTLAELAQAGGKIGEAGGAAQRLGRRDHVRAGAEQTIVGRHGAVEIEHARNAALLRRQADRRDEIRIMDVEQHRVGLANRRVRIGRGHFFETLVAARGDHFLAFGIDQDQRHGRKRAGHAQRAAAVDVLAHENADNAVGDFVIAAAKRAGKRHLAAEAGDRDGGIAGLAAAGDEEVGRLHLAAGIGEFVHPHHNVLHGAAGAQNSRDLFLRGVRQSRSRPPPRRG